MMISFVLYIIVYAVTGSTEATIHAKECPSWYLPVNESLPYSGEPGCKCGSELGGVIRCEKNLTIRLSVLHCMTSEPSTGTVEGYCPYGNNLKSIDAAFKPQPSSPSELTKFTCGWLNRTGILCSYCEDALGVSVLSYSFKCVECLGKVRGWVLYLVLALVPLTVFFFIIILCNIDATAAHMNSLLCILQILIFSLNTNPQTFIETGNVLSKYLVIGAWTVIGVWNLDIFRYVYPSFCISPDISILQVISLEYIIALYPLFLIAVAYVLIELHDNGYRVVKIPWKVTRRCLKLFIRNRNIHVNFQPMSSIIKHFSTFLLLAYTKLLFVNYNLLAFTSIFKTDGNRFGKHNRVFYNASIQYVSSKHLPYFTLASVIMTLFNVIPLLILLLYPTKLFQKALSCCKLIRWHPLRAFADKFQGCYKDGTSKSRDYRYFAGIYLLIRILYHIRAVWNSNYSIFISQLIPLVSAALFGILRPYKNDLYNRLDCGLFSILTFGQICLATNKYVADLPVTLLYIFAAIPLGYLLMLIIYKCFSVCAPKFTQQLRRKGMRKLGKNNLLFLPEVELASSYAELQDDDDDEILHIRDRVQNSVRCIQRFLPSIASLNSAGRGTKVSSIKTTYSTCDINGP